MIIDKDLKENFTSLRKLLELIENQNIINEKQIESFLRTFEQKRYNILNEIKKHNSRVEFESEKIKTLDDEYKADFIDGVLKIFIPEVMPSYKNLKTHSHKKILLNVSEITKQYAGLFNDGIFIYIKVFDNSHGWDIDNKYIKPISDALILAKVIPDDNYSKMFYCAKGEYSEQPHTEVYVFDSKNIYSFLEKISY